MKKTFITILLIFSAISLFTACSKSDVSNNNNSGISFSCAGITPNFSTDVQQILTTVCSFNSNCHGAGSINAGGPFTSYAEVNAKRSTIRTVILAGTMPQTGSITQAQINAFICWIDSGAPNN